MLHSIAPFFIVADLECATAFYRDLLGFRVAALVPEDDPLNPTRVLPFVRELPLAPGPNEVTVLWSFTLIRRTPWLHHALPLPPGTP